MRVLFRSGQLRGWDKLEGAELLSPKEQDKVTVYQRTFVTDREGGWGKTLKGRESTLD